MSRTVLFCSFLLYGLASTEHCGLPPSVWCSSKEVARRCDVEKQCEPYLNLSNKGRLVSFTLYFESLCPDCRYFITSQLYPTFKSIGSIMNLTLVPYGNANEQRVGNKWKFTCQHGEEECYGNLIETCAIHFHPNVSVHFPFIHCIEASTSYPKQAAKGCAAKFDLDYSQIMSCVEGPLGNSLEHEMAVKTDALQPPHQYVPWVTLNGVHTKTIQNEAEEDLKRLICETYQGSPKPSGCANKPRESKSTNILNV